MSLEWLGFRARSGRHNANIPTTIIVTNKNLCVREPTRPTRSTSATNQSELGLKLIAPRALQAAA
jgi:hypothetical protein